MKNIGIEKRSQNKLISGYSLFDSNLLVNRGITTPQEADFYFNANFDDLGDYWTIKDLKPAAYFIKDCIDNNKRIKIYGDYDVDGATSTAELFTTIKDCGGNVEWEVPCRIKNGYGLSMTAVKQMVKDNYDLIITVDNGIRAIDEIKYAKEHNVDVIVVDHHIVGKEMPCANYVIDLHRDDEVYPYHDFCGAGVAFMLSRALYQLFEFDDDYCKKHLDIVAIGTIADVMELTGENRILVKEGLKRICDTTNYNRYGIIQLLRLNFMSDHVLSTDIGFSIAPCLNAPGRLLVNGADLAVQLLLEEDVQKANQLGSYLYRVNEVRKEKTKDGLEIAEEYIIDHHLENDKIIIIYIDDMEEGIIGLISGKITEKYYKPSIVFTKNIKGNYKASARSIPTIDLYECLCSCHPLFIKYGGHEQAAGLEIDPSNLEELRDNLNMYIEDNYNEECFIRPKFYEEEVSIDEITPSFVEKLERYEPCGCGNERPLLFIKEFPTIKRKTKFSNEIQFYSMYGDKEQHVTLYGSNSDLQGFELGEKFNYLGRPNVVSALFQLEISDAMGTRHIVLDAKDIDNAIETTAPVKRNTSVKNKIKSLADLL